MPLCRGGHSFPDKSGSRLRADRFIRVRYWFHFNRGCLRPARRAPRRESRSRYIVSKFRAANYFTLIVGLRPNCYCNLQRIELMNVQIYRQFDGARSTGFTSALENQKKFQFTAATEYRDNFRPVRNEWPQAIIQSSIPACPGWA